MGAAGAIGHGIVLIAGRPQLVAASATVLGCSYAAALSLEPGDVDLSAPLVGALLLLTCELAYWAHELRTSSPDEPGLRSGHAAWLSALTLGALALGAVLVVVVGVARTSGVVVEVVGASAAFGALVVLSLIVRRQLG